MGFGQGRFRRTKWIFFTFSGPKVGVVKRSKAQSSRAAMKAALGHASVDLQVTSLDELTLELVIEKVRKLPGVDGKSRRATSARRGVRAPILSALAPRRH